MTTTIVVLVLAVAAVLLVGPARIWELIGPADLGDVDFAKLVRRNSPNDALAAPSGMSRARVDIEPPVFLSSAGDLRNALAQVTAKELRIKRVAADDATLTDRYVQRSAVLGFPDTIVVRFVPLPDGRSTLALYSRSQLGYSDMGVNKARLRRWLDGLRHKVPVAP